MRYIFTLYDSDVLIRNWKDSEVSMLPTYEKLIAAGLRIWVFRYSYTITNTCVNIISTSGTLKFFDFNAAATQIQ